MKLTTVPVPLWPGSLEYPGFVLTTTMWTMFPEMFAPDFVTELDTRTAKYWGNGPGGGPELFPGSLVQEPPQAGRLELVSLANPLNELGAGPLLGTLALAHWAPQKVTLLPAASSLSAMTKAAMDVQALAPAGLVVPDGQVVHEAAPPVL
jgi:hypothetical protein